MRAARFLAATTWGAALAVLVASCVRLPAGAGSSLEQLFVWGALLVETFRVPAVLATTIGVFGSVLFSGLRRRVPYITLVCAAVVMGWGVPPLVPTGVPEHPEPDEELVVYALNLMYGTGEAGLMLAEAERVGADVLVLSEFTPEFERDADALIRARYPFAHGCARDDGFGLMIYSRLPFEGPAQIPAISWETPQPRVRLTVGTRVVEVWGVHLQSPGRPWIVTKQREEVERMAADLRAVLDTPPEASGIDAVVIAGDFNAPWRTGHLRELRRVRGVHEAHDALAWGAGSTWPHVEYGGATGLMMAAFGETANIRLDHVVVSPGAVALETGVGQDTRSDHLGVWARVGVFGRDTDAGPEGGP